jgi:hypothetical protein
MKVADGSVQDHLLHSKNGEIKPNHRDNYLHGNSLPIKQEDIALTVEKLIADLSKRAGGGPTCRSPLYARHRTDHQIWSFTLPKTDWLPNTRNTSN